MEILLAAIVIAVLGGTAYAAWRMRPSPGRRPAAPHRPAEPRITAPVTTLVLDVRAGDPDSPSVRRLVRSVALPVFQRSDDVEEVVVKDREGEVVGRLHRPAPAPPPQEHPEPPPDLRLHPPVYEPSHGGAATGPGPVADDDTHTDFADRYDLSTSIREQVRDPDDPVEVVRAIIAASGRPATVSGPSVLTDGDLLIVVPGHRGVVTGDHLTQAYLLFDASRARRGIAICLGYVDPDELRRREILAPNLRHTGHEAIQRMADAVALGADPLAFIEGPPAVSEL